MRSRLGAAVAVALWALAAPAFAATNTDIRDVDIDQWPRVSISVAGTPGSEGSFVVTEDGAQVEDLKVRSFTEAGAKVDVVLVIDTSGSMQGEPMAAALAASRDFVRGVPDNIRIGIVTFSDTPRVALRLTEDRDAALAVLEKPVARGETALYDAMRLASGVFSGKSQRNIVLLSDGGDTASTGSLDGVIAATRKSGASVYSVGLTTGEADVPVLKRFASIGKGRFAPAGAADLSSLYRGFVTEFENQYVLSYRSETESGSEFTLEVTADGTTDSAVIIAPEAVTAPREVEPPEPSEPLLQGEGGLAVVLSLTFLVCAIVIYGFLGSTLRRRRDATLQRLIAARPDGQGGTAEAEDRPTWIPGSLAGMADNVAKRAGWAEKFDKKLDRGGVSLSPGEYLASVFIAAVVGAVIGVLFTSSLFFGILIGIASAFVPHAVVSIKINRRFKKLEAQLPDILMVIASSLRAGHSFLQALDAVAAEIGDPGGHEFSRLVGEVRLGRSVNVAMNDLAERVGSEDFNWAILAVNIQREVGGNLAEVLDTVATTMRGRQNVRRQVAVLSAEGRLSMYILGALPILIGMYLWLVNREYLALLYTTGVGVALLIGAGILFTVGFFWMSRVVKIDV